MRSRGLLVSRRAFLRAGTGTIALGGGMALLGACAPNSLTSNPAAATGDTRGGQAVQLPSYVPVQGPKPDLPGTADGIDPGYIRFPTELFKSVTETPGKGGEVNIMVWNILTPMSPLDQNPAWQEINKQTGVNIKLTIVPYADYNTRLATVIAGDELADAIFIPPGNANLGAFAEFLKARCQDLTPFLSGAAVKDYPNIANFRTKGWEATLYNDGIYGVPSQYPLYFWSMWVHKELFDAVTPDWPKSADEFKKVMQDVTRPSDGVYGITTEPTGGFTTWNGMFPAMFGAPNQWRLDSSGKLTRTFETDEYRAAVSFARDLHRAGVFTPSSDTNNNVQGKAEFAQRKAAVRWDGFVGMATQAWDAAPTLNPPSTVRVAPPIAADGKSKPVYWFGTGTFGMTVLKKASSDRIKEILRIINFIAAPFGSQEHLLLNYGIKDVDFTYDVNGNPVATDAGKQDVNTLWTTGKAAPPVLYYPKSDKFAPTMQGDEKPMFNAGSFDPTTPLYSPTNASKGGQLNQVFQDGLTDIVAGRRPLSDFDQLVSDWRSAGGDQVRAEYQQALQAAGGVS